MIVGAVEVEVRSLVDRPKFEKDIDRPLNVAAANAGARFGTVLGKAIGTAVRPFAGRAGDEAGAQFTKHAREHGLSMGRTLGAGLVAGLGFSAGRVSFDSLFHGIEGTIGAADELEKAVTRTHDTFGAAADSVEAFGKSSTKNLLLTRTAALQAASAYGDILRGVGVGAAPAAATSTALVGVAENLAAIKGLQVDTVLHGLQGALQGTSRNVRALGLDLSTGRVAAEAYALGLARPVKDAGAIRSAQDKVAAATANLAKVQREHGFGTLAAAQAQDKLSGAQRTLTAALSGKNTKLSQEIQLQARAALILRETQKSTGGASREADTYAVATQRLHKQLGDLSSTIGHGLLPYEARLTSGLADLVTQFQSGTGTGGELRTELVNLGRDAHALGEDLKPVVGVAKWFVDHPEAFRAAAEAMVIYAAATKSAALWSKLIVPIPPIPPGVPAAAGGGAATAAEAGGFGAILARFGLRGGAAVEGVAAGGGAIATGIGRISGIPLPGLGSSTRMLPSSQQLHHGPNGTLIDGAGNVYKDGHRIAGALDLSPHAPNTPDDYDIKAGRGRSAVSQVVAQVQAAHQAATKAAADDGAATAYAADQFAAFQQAQRDAITKATDAARAEGETVTASLHAQLDRLKQSESALEEQGRKITDYRSQVLGQAASFSSFTSLLPDNSLASAGGLVASLQGRLGADRLFATNLSTLTKRHLDKGVLDELAQAGPEAGRALAAALVGGSDAQLGQINLAEKALRQQQQVIAQQATDTKFGADALAANTRAINALLVEQKKTNRLLAVEPALIAKAVDQAQRNNQVTRNGRTRTAVTS